MYKVYNPLTYSNLSLVEFIEAKINPNSTLNMLSRKSRRAPPKVDGKTRLKSLKIANRTTPPRHTWHDRASQHGQAVPHCWPAGAGWSLGAQSCALLSARVLPRFSPFCSSWCSGLPRSSNLLWTYFWSSFFHRNPMISPEMKTKCNLGTIWIEGR